MFDDLVCVSIAVESLERATADYEQRLGFVAMGPVHCSERGFALRWRNLGNGHSVLVELLEPTSPMSPVAKFLRSRGEGVYQVRLTGYNLKRTVAELEARGTRVVGADGSSEPDMCWIHPGSTHGVLFELMPSEKIGGDP